jgi:hypothetical protein
MKKRSTSFRSNAKHARLLWGESSPITLRSLKELTDRYDLSIAAGDLLLLDGRWYITHSGLLRLATRNRCSSIRAQPLREYCDAAASRWVFRATVQRYANSKGFVGYGDADPSNVSSLVHGAEMRMAETRAVNRALRKAFGIGLCSVEELGNSPGPYKANGNAPKDPIAVPNNGQPRVRDQLCQLIRKYNLDPNLVKQYAADFCGTKNLREANRDSVEAFVASLSEQAASDRDNLLCRLNGYQAEEAKA